MSSLWPRAGFASVWFGLTLGLGACGGVGLPTPKPPSAIDLLGTNGAPLVVDWDPATRGDLEVAMGRGIAVVAYGKGATNGSHGIELLPDCKLEGSYGFFPVVLKEQVLTFSSGDELRANLPFSGFGLAPKLEGEFSSGAALDVALVMVGKKTSTLLNAERTAVRGDPSCARATHFVRGAWVGAFAMDLGTRAKARAAADVFGAQASWRSQTAKGLTQRDGSLDACRKHASPEDKGAECGALLQLELRPIGDRAKAEELLAGGADCPRGFVRSQGKCVASQGSSLHQCSLKDRAECQEMCDRGHAGSCGTLGYLLTQAVGEKRDFQKIASLYQRACDGGAQFGCAGIAVLMDRGKYFARDPEQSFRLSMKACDAGDPRGCGNAGIDLRDGHGTPPDLQRARVLMERSCNGGWPHGCQALGEEVVGDGAEAALRAAALFRRACEGGEPSGCRRLAGMMFDGEGVARDPNEAERLLRKTCLEDGRSCTNLAARYDKGDGVRKDPDAAAALYRDAARLLQDNCDIGYSPSCDDLGDLYRGGHGVPKDEAKACKLYEMACGMGLEHVCTYVATAAACTSDPRRSQELLAASCDRGGMGSCNELASKLEDKATKKDEIARVLDLYTRACDGRVGSACHQLGWIHERGKLGITRDFAKAAALYEKACTLRLGGACAQLGILFETARGVTKDLQRANALYEQGCKLGSGGSCRFLGMNHRAGLGLPKDLAEAFKAYKRGCEAGDSDSCEVVAGMYKRGEGTDANPRAAAEMYVKWCEDGQAPACLNAAILYEEGPRGLPRDVERAIVLLKKGCANGSGAACGSMAARYERGDGVDKSEERALAMHDRACERKVGSSCTRLAKARESGRGLAKDLEGAADLYERACDLEDADGCYERGQWLELGKTPVKLDLEAAFEAYRTGCREGSGPACFRAGGMAAIGRGTARDEEEAARAYERGCENDHAQACALAASAYLRGAGVTRDADRAKELAARGRELAARPLTARHP